MLLNLCNILSVIFLVKIILPLQFGLVLKVMKVTEILLMVVLSLLQQILSLDSQN